MRRFFLFYIPVALLAFILVPSGYVRAQFEPPYPYQVFIPLIASSGEDSPADALSSFTATVTNGEAQTLRGLFSPNGIGVKIVQQPAGMYSYVSTANSTATQFALAQQGVTGLLAHNYLAGELFFYLQAGDALYLVYGDGRIEKFTVTAIHRYQALDPASPSSDFIDQSNGDRLTAAQVFARHYMDGPRVTLQTCIAQDGNLSWGRLFITALP